MFSNEKVSWHPLVWGGPLDTGSRTRICNGSRILKYNRENRNGKSHSEIFSYEILVNNRQVDPMTVRLPTGKHIDPVHLNEFKKQVQMVEAEVLARGTQRFAVAVSVTTTP